MYIIIPYQSANNLNLNSKPAEIERILGKSELTSNEYAPDYLTGVYIGGITVAYKESLSSYIGIPISLSPTHLDFNFSHKSYDEVMNYFRHYKGTIYIEDEYTAIISESLGISTYFEDGLKEVGIFSKNYGAEIMNELKVI